MVELKKGNIGLLALTNWFNETDKFEDNFAAVEAQRTRLIIT